MERGVIQVQIWLRKIKKFSRNHKDVQISPRGCVHTNRKVHVNQFYSSIPWIIETKMVNVEDYSLRL